MKATYADRIGRTLTDLSTVLIVDDDPSTRVVIRTILEMDGHEVVEAGRGETALELIRLGRLPDVVTTDLRMPGLGGEELIRRLRAEPATAAIAIIALSSDAQALRELRAGGLVDAIVAKPFHARTITKCVRAVAKGPEDGTQTAIAS